MQLCLLSLWALAFTVGCQALTWHFKLYMEPQCTAMPRQSVGYTRGICQCLWASYQPHMQQASSYYLLALLLLVSILCRSLTSKGNISLCMQCPKSEVLGIIHTFLLWTCSAASLFHEIRPPVLPHSVQRVRSVKPSVVLTCCLVCCS